MLIIKTCNVIQWVCETLIYSKPSPFWSPDVANWMTIPALFYTAKWDDYIVKLAVFSARSPPQSSNIARKNTIASEVLTSHNSEN